MAGRDTRVTKQARVGGCAHLRFCEILAIDSKQTGLLDKLAGTHGLILGKLAGTHGLTL